MKSRLLRIVEQRTKELRNEKNVVRHNTEDSFHDRQETHTSALYKNYLQELDNVLRVK